MGMYTELVLKCRISDGLPDQAMAVLELLFNGGGDPKEIPNHPFFSCPRWRAIGGMCSYYHVPWSASKFSEGYIFSRSDLKNYDAEIEKFIDWLMPYLDHQHGDVIGWSWYEEDSEPTIIRI